MRAYGWRPDPSRNTLLAPRASDRLKAEPPPPSAVDLRPYAVQIFQGFQGSCCAHAIVLGLLVWACARGLLTADMANLASRRFVYKIGRAIDGQHGDTGMYPSSAFRALQIVGAPAESVYPYDGTQTLADYLDEIPPQSVYQKASDFARSIREHRIFEKGETRFLLVRQALAAKLPVLIGLEVDQAFEAASPGDIIDAPDTLKATGGHALLVVGYRTNPDGSVDYLIRNWWGVDWGDYGDGWVTAGFLDACTDVWVIDAAGVPEAA